MNRTDVQRWLDRYIEAWRSRDPEVIAALFTDDAVYGYRPWDSDEDTVRGRDAIVEAWMSSEDPPGWRALYEPYAVDGDRAVAVGTSRYPALGEQPERTYHNAFLLEFAADGRVAAFHEFYMLEGR